MTNKDFCKSLSSHKYMECLRWTAFLLLALCLFINGATAAEYVPGEVLVKFKSGTGTIRANDVNYNVGAVTIRKFEKVGVQRIKLAESMSVEDAVDYYKSNSNVEYAEPNYIIHAAILPDDPSFNLQWGLDSVSDRDIDAPEAWGLTTGSSSVIIAVLDSGIDYSHPDLDSNIWSNSGETNCSDNIDNDGNGYVDDCRGWDFVNNDNDPEDYSGHGTHVAGTIAAIGNNGTGISGVMWQASIMPLKTLDRTGIGNTAAALSAIEYAIANGAKILNASWGGYDSSSSLKAAIDASNVLVVSAAGNENNDNDTRPFYPAGYDSPNIISVAATNTLDNLADFSNFGLTSVDLGAPGVTIYSTVAAREEILTDNFNDGNLSNPVWTTGGTPDNWAVSGHMLMDSPSGNYSDNADTWARTDLLNLAGKFGCKIEFSLNLNLLDTSNDSLRVEASTDPNNWSLPELATYASSTNEYKTLSLQSMEGKSTAYVRFRLVSDASGNSSGASIDDVEITCDSNTYSGTIYKNSSGTSMATPHVSGVAGLILSKYSALTPCQVKDMILNTIDSTGLAVLTGGRLNAFNALKAMPGPDTCPQPVSSAGGGGGGGGGGCFIATAAYGSPVHPYVKELREFRDDYLATNDLGRAFINAYYKYSPPIAYVIKDSSILKFITRVLLTPVVILIVFPYVSIMVLAVLLSYVVLAIRKIM